MTKKRNRLITGLFVSAIALATSAHADIITNGDFSSGSLAGWTVFTTSNGTAGYNMPSVISYNTTGSGASLAAQFQVGEIQYDQLPNGGGISQSVSIPTSGNYTFSLDYAAQNNNTVGNADAGTFSLVVDGAVISSVSLGDIAYNGVPAILRGSLDQEIFLSSGIHLLSVEITRDYQSSSSTPLQFLDNISLDPDSPSTVTPEPSSVLLLATGLFVFGVVLAHRRFTEFTSL